MREPDPSPNIFTFVNKNASSASLSNEKTGQTGVSKVNSHVQRVRQLKKQTYLRRQTSSVKKVVGWRKALDEQSPTAPSSDATSESPSKHFQICHLDHRRHRCPSTSINLPIGSPSDPFRSLGKSINTKNHQVLQYYMTLRQPRGSTPDSHIAAFTPLGEHDQHLSMDIVETILSIGSDLPLNALLAGMASRMKFFTSVPLSSRDYPENYTVKAIQAFRKHIDAGEPINDQVVFAMRNLSMAEYSSNNSDGAKLYWRMVRSMVIHLGGFEKFEPYVAWLCISADYLVAASTFTLPELDFITFPKLSGAVVPTAAENANAMMATPKGSACRQPRLQDFITDTVSLTQIIGHIQKFPKLVVSGVKNLVMSNRSAVYQLLTMQLTRKLASSSPSINTAISTEALDRVMLAYATLARARHLGFVIWLWHSSLSFVSTPGLPENLLDIPFLKAEHMTALKTKIQLADRNLLNSGWALHEDLVLWLCSLISLVPSASDEMDFFVARLVRAAKQLEIRSVKQLQKALDVFPPLGGIKGYDATKFYELISTVKAKSPVVAARDSALRS